MNARAESTEWSTEWPRPNRPPSYTDHPTKLSIPTRMRQLLHLQRCELSRCSRSLFKLAYYRALQRWRHGPNQLPTPYLCHIRHPR